MNGTDTLDAFGRGRQVPDADLEAVAQAVLREVEAHHGGQKTSRSRWSFWCPYHPDEGGRKRSAWLNVGGSASATWGCQKGCHRANGGGGIFALAKRLNVDLPDVGKVPKAPSRKAASASRPTPAMMDKAQVDAALDGWLEARGLDLQHLAPFAGRAEPYTWHKDGDAYTGPALILPTGRWDDAARIRRLDPAAPSWVAKVKWDRTLEAAPPAIDPEGRGVEKRPGALYGWEEAVVRLSQQQEAGDRPTLWLVNGHASAIGAHAAGLAAVALESGEGPSTAADFWARRLGQELGRLQLEEPLVLVAYDNDPTGREGGQAVAQAVAQAGGDRLLVRIVDLSRHPAAARKGGDVGDVVAAVGLEDAAEALAELATSPWSLPPSWTFAEGLGDPAPVDWLVEHMLQADTVAALYGPPGAGKSLVALDWSARVAQQGLVLYIAAEGAHGLPRRRRAWELAHPAQQIPPRRLVFQLTASNLLDPAHVAELVARVQQVQAELGPLRLVVVDTLARAIPGGDENSAAVMGQAVAALDLVRRAAGGATVLVLHHPGKSNGGLRGSSALQGAVDATLELSAQGLEDGGAMVLRSGDLITVRSVKQKDAEPGRRVVYAFRVQELDQADGAPITGACVVDSDVAPVNVPKRPHKEAEALAIMAGLDWSAAPLSHAVLQEAVLEAGFSKGSWFNWRRAWLAGGILAKEGAGYVQGPKWEELAPKVNRVNSRSIDPTDPVDKVGQLGQQPLRVDPLTLPTDLVEDDQEELEQIALLHGLAPAHDDRPRPAGQDCPACGAGLYHGGSCSNPRCTRAAPPCEKCGRVHDPVGACPPPTPTALGG